MAPEAHAILSASSSSRWLACPPSALLNAKAPDQGSTYAAEGTEAHALCEYRLKRLLGVDDDELTDPNLVYFDGEMNDCVDGYVQYVQELLSEIKGEFMVLVEHRLDFSRWVPHGFGTGDCIIVGGEDKTINVIDFKYGQGVEVDAENNSQMMCYALGAYDAFGRIYDIDTVIMTIYQPRRAHISTSAIAVKDLLAWADTVLKPTAQLAAQGKGELNAGGHCRFCKVKATCRKRAEYNLTLAEYDFKEPMLLDNYEIADVLTKADSLVSWVSDVKEYALSRALQGEKFDGFKVVEGRSSRKFTDQDAVAKAVEAAGFDPYEHKVKGITAMIKMLGGKKATEVLSDYVVKPHGKPTLVPESDKRPPFDTAKEDFSDF